MDISPEKQSIDKLFGSTTFYIDFYQRQYKWNEDPVNRLLDDVFHKFNSEYSRNKELTPHKETITAKYSWYYLNTYVTNSIEGRVYLVDGQQRLTTLTGVWLFSHIENSAKTFPDWVVGFLGLMLICYEVGERFS